MKIIKNRATLATVWMVAGFGTSSGLRLAGNLVLARLLIPKDFGIMALIVILMQGLVMFSDVGIGPGIIRSRRGDDPDFLNTAWTIQVFRGLALWVCAGILAIPFARFYNEPAFLLFVPVACVNVFIAGFNNTALFTENRALNLGRITSIEIISQVAGLALMVTWALIYPTVWALIAGGILSTSLKALLSHLMFPAKKNAFRWQRSAISEIINFGKWIFLSSILGFTSSQIDRVMLGKLVPLDIFGLYSIGFMWAQAPLQLVQAWSSKVFFPVAAKAMVTGKSGEASSLLARRRKLLLIMAPLIAGLIVAMPKLVVLLYLPIFHLAGPIGSILATGVWIGILASTYGAINMAGGKPQYISFAAAAKTVLFIALVFPFFDSWGINGVAIAVVVSQMGRYVCNAIGANRLGFSSVVSDIILSAMITSLVYVNHVSSTFAEKAYNSSIVDLIVIFCVSFSIAALILLYSRLKRPRLDVSLRD